MGLPNQSKNSLTYRFPKWIVDHPWRALSIFLLIMLVMLPGILKIRSSYTPKVWFDPGHPIIKKLNTFEKRFGNDQNIVVGLYHPDGIFQKPVLREIQRLTEEMWQVTDVIRVETLANYNYIEAEGDDIIIEPFLPEDLELSPEELKSLKEKALADEVIPDFYISPDGTFAIIYGYMRPYFDDEPDFSKVVNDVRAMTKGSSKIEGLRTFIIGDAAGNDAFREISAGDNEAIIPFMIIFINILLFLNFRSLLSIALPLFLIGTTVGVAFGFLGWVGVLFNSLLSAIPGVLLAICLADAVHILNSYFHFRMEKEDSKTSILYSLMKNCQPTLLTSVSTAISFFSITQTEIAPVRDLGLVCGFGTLIAWVFTYLLIGPTISLMSARLDKFEVKSFQFGKLLKGKVENIDPDDRHLARAAVNWIDRFKLPIILLFTLLTAGSVWKAMDNEVNSDPIKYFHPDVPVRTAYDFTSTKINGLKGIELVADAGKENGVKDPEFLRKLDAYMQWMKGEPEITKVKSIMEVIKKMNKILHGGDEKYYRIPDSQKAVAEILFLYTVGLPQGMDLNNQITLDNRRLRMRVVWTIETSKETEKMANQLLAKAPEFGLNIDTGGNVPIYMQINTMVVTSFFKSMAMALFFVGLLLLVVFKDFFIALLSMLPNIIPLAFGGALMAVMGKYIDIGSSLVYTVCLGIAVDDTIHFVASYKNYRNNGLSPIEACVETFHITGKALVVTTVLLVVGFGSFMFADFVPNRNFGIFCSVILLLALLTDLFFLPALLLVVDKGDQKAARSVSEKVTPVTDS